VHMQSNGNQVQCFWWTCVQKGCKLDGRPIKEICKNTGQLFRHLKNCNNHLWLRLQLSSKHSKTQLDEEGELMQVSLEPYMSAKQPYISAKEPYISAKESDIESDGSAAAEEAEEDGEALEIIIDLPIGFPINSIISLSLERRIKREDTRRTSTVLFATLNKTTHTVSALELHCALSTEHSKCTQHSVHNKS